MSIGSAVGEIWKAIPERRGSRGKNRMLCIRTGCAAASAAAEIELARVLRWRSESEAGGSIGLSFAGMSAGLERFVHRPSALLPPSFGRHKATASPLKVSSLSPGSMMDKVRVCSNGNQKEIQTCLRMPCMCASEFLRQRGLQPAMLGHRSPAVNYNAILHQKSRETACRDRFAMLHVRS